MTLIDNRRQNATSLDQRIRGTSANIATNFWLHIDIPQD